jgi:chromate reductase, NAD(P)H dehydrogenase (quinone)
MEKVLMKKNVFVIIGSASSFSSNEKLIQHVVSITNDICNITICNYLKTLPHFEPELSTHNPPNEVVAFRNSIEKADGVIICTPEYVYSIPALLKNALEWCVATTVFTNKPVGLITASAHGKKGHEALELIMKTLDALFTKETSLLVQGIKGKFDAQGNIIDEALKKDITHFTEAYKKMLP